MKNFELQDFSIQELSTDKDIRNLPYILNNLRCILKKK